MKNRKINHKKVAARRNIAPPVAPTKRNVLVDYCYYLEKKHNEMQNTLVLLNNLLVTEKLNNQDLIRQRDSLRQELKNLFQGNIQIREQYYSLQRNYSQERKNNYDMKQECAALQWQSDFNRKYIADIQNSRSWHLARQLHFLYGFLFFRREIMQEAREAWTNLVQKSQNSALKNNQRNRLIFLLNYLAQNTYHLFKPQPSALPAPLQGEAAKQLREIKIYDSTYQDEETFDLSNQEVKTIAFYLPQYHTFPENDQWWGKGFTEWTNTRKAQPRFPKHYQPREPHPDIGYYDLSKVATLRRQAELAKRHGINAFCFYYYWFDGKKLMEKPLELLMANPDIDLPFCLCWANENWTRTWDGQEKSVLIEQNYSLENDVNFIRDLVPYLRDHRYLRCGGKPVILVYHVKILPDPDRTFAMWRKYCRENGIGEIQIWSCRTFIQSNQFKKSVEVDREVEFPPHMIASLKMFPPEKFKAYDKSGNFYDYSAIIKDVMTEHTLADRANYPIYRCAMLGWDNSSRRATGWSVWQYFSLKSYHTWLRKIIAYTKKNFPVDERFVFINAWNEWAEGTYLEPDERYGYANINTTTRALCNLPQNPEYNLLLPQAVSQLNPGKILLHLHCFYNDLIAEFVECFNHIPFPYDCIITTDSTAKKRSISHYLREHPLTNCLKHQVVVTPNCGRDVAPFFASCSKLVHNYDFVGHFHTKRSLTVDWGDEWRHYLLHNLLGSTEIVQGIFQRFARDTKLGLYFPTAFPPMKNYMNWEKNRPRIEQLLQKMGYKLNLPDTPLFPVGQMFWARTAAVKAIFEPEIVRKKDFEPEKDQLSDTLSHAIERIWSYVAQGANYTTLTGVFPGNFAAKFAASELAAIKAVKRVALFVHYQKDGLVSDADCYLLQQLKGCADIVFISNGNLNPETRQKLKPLISHLIERKNEGYDFGAWRDALAKISLKGYQELILLNNSILGPFRPLENIFAEMAHRNADFWGLTRFPQTCNPRREEAKLLPGNTIPRHIQSFFTVYSRKVFTSEAFKNFWKNVRNETDLPAVVAHYETQLSNVLERANFKSDVYLHAAERLQEHNTTDPSFNAIYCHPQDFLALNFPFLKKNICYYMKQAEINETIHMIGRFSDYPIKFIHITEKTR